MTELLLADDDAPVLEAMAAALRQEGYTVLTSSSGTGAWNLIQTGQFDLAVLDINMPGLDGVQLTRLIRAQVEEYLPVILLTGRDGEDDQVEGLDVGADDYVIKPCSPRTLSARIRSVLRRRSAAGSVLREGSVSLDMQSHAVYLGEQPITVTVTEFVLLRILLEHARQVVPARTIMQKIWGASVSDDLLRVTIFRLRRKIERDPKRPQLIHTVAGVGFVLRDDTASV